MADTNKPFFYEKLWTPANVVTLLRICGVPVFVVALLSPWPTWFPFWSDAEYWKEWVAAGIFIILAATDGLDGYLARSRGEVTNFGKFMDPLADKILVAAALLALIELSILPSWVALIILCREFIVSGIRMVAANQGLVIAASWYGKAKTVLQIIALVLFIIKDSHMVASFSEVLSDHLYLISWAVMIVALFFTIISMLDYFSRARTVFGFSDSKKPVAAKREKELPPSICPNGLSDELRLQAEEVIKLYRKNNKKMGTAESCTGGLIAAALTAIPGSSEVVAGGIVSYSNDIKNKELEVPLKILTEKGAVSEETACAMAQGAFNVLDVDVAVAVTGIAGPGGGSAEKPVGTVWIGVCDKKAVTARCFHFRGNRESVRHQTTYEALCAFQKALS